MLSYRGEKMNTSTKREPETIYFLPSRNVLDIFIVIIAKPCLYAEPTHKPATPEREREREQLQSKDISYIICPSLASNTQTQHTFTSLHQTKQATCPALPCPSWPCPALALPLVLTRSSTPAAPPSLMEKAPSNPNQPNPPCSKTHRLTE